MHGGSISYTSFDMLQNIYSNKSKVLLSAIIILQPYRPLGSSTGALATIRQCEARRSARPKCRQLRLLTSEAGAYIVVDTLSTARRVTLVLIPPFRPRHAGKVSRWAGHHHRHVCRDNHLRMGVPKAIEAHDSSAGEGGKFSSHRTTPFSKCVQQVVKH